MLISVCERTSRWTAALEKASGSLNQTSVRWFPHFSDLLAACKTASSDVVLLVVECSDQGLDQIAQLGALSPSPSLLVLAEGDDFQFECLARELGAAQVFPVTTPESLVLASVERLLSISSGLK